MKVTQEKLPASQIGLDIEISPEMSKNAYEQVIRQYARSVNIPGFRKGKVPRHILVQRLGVDRIKAAALDDLMQQCLPKAVEQENIPAIGSFELRGDVEALVAQYEPGQLLTIKAAVDVAPEVKLGQYKGLTVQAEEVKSDAARVDQVLEQEQAKLATLIPVENRPAQTGDMAFVDFKGVLETVGEDGEPQEIPGGQAENFQVELVEGQFIPGFTEGMIGMNPGETKELQVKFPDDYGNEELAGQPAVFTVTLNELKEKELPELDDEFAEEVSEFSTLAELRESLEKRFQQEAEDQTTANKHKALVEAIVADLQVEIPETMIRQEVDQVLTQQAMQLSQMGVDIKRLFTQEMIPQMRERSRPQAIEQLKQSLALKEIAKQESITVSEEDIKAEETKAMEQLQGQEVDLDRLREVVTEDLLKKKTYAWLEENCTIELVPEGSLTQSEESEQPETSEETSEVEVEVLTSDSTETSAESESVSE
ncbi:MAG: trigger factor [Limnoraphis sp. WC205]|jgi:trigger factor|nr:trigger factor [Limnoraphis sp. WC205]